MFIKHWFCLSCYRGRLRVNDDDGQYPFDPSIFSPFRILDLPLAKMRPIDTDVAWSLSLSVCVCPSVCVSVLFVITTSDAKTAEKIEIGPTRLYIKDVDSGGPKESCVSWVPQRKKQLFASPTNTWFIEPTRIHILNSISGVGHQGGVGVYIGYLIDGLLSIPRLRTKFGGPAFSHAGPATWNALPDHIRTVADPVKFRQEAQLSPRDHAMRRVN